MKTGAMTRKSPGTIVVLIIAIIAGYSVMALAPVAFAQTFQPYSAEIENDEYEATVGEPFSLLLSLALSSPPPGYFVSVLVDVIDGPDKGEPEIVTGFPRVRLTMRQPGVYRMAVRVSLMSKSSCGGIGAQEILAEEIQLEVADL